MQSAPGVNDKTKRDYSPTPSKWSKHLHDTLFTIDCDSLLCLGDDDGLVMMSFKQH